MDVDLATATASQLTAALRSREISSRELLAELLGRCSRINPDLNAIVAWDLDRAQASAAAADEAIARGESAGRLHGLPMTVKDTFETAGLVTTAGAPELAQHIPENDAIAVGRLRHAGAVVFGKSNAPLYAGDWQTYNNVYGRTSNPWDLRRTTGGSSGGAAAAVAAGLTPLELGSDIGGSIRNPAHYNGVYGLKPSWGIVPVLGHIPGPPGSLVTTDVGVAGPIARSVGDLRLALSVLAGPLPEDAAGWRLELDAGPPVSGAPALRVATVFGEGRDVVPLAGGVRSCLDGLAVRLADAGAVVDEVALPVSLADGFRSWRDLTLPIIGVGLPDDAYAAQAEHGRGRGADQRDPDVVIARAMTSSYRDWTLAVERRQRQRQAWAEFFGRYDVVLAPVMPTAAFPHDTEQPLARRRIDVDGAGVSHFSAAAWCGAIGAMQLPVVVLPAGLDPAGLPVGVQVIGPYLSDLRLLRIAEIIDAAAGPGFTPPPVAAAG